MTASENPPAPPTLDDVLRCLASLGTAEAGTPRRLERRWLDSFDWRLAAAGLALAEEGEGAARRLMLTDTDGRKVASAEGGIGDGFAEGLPEGALRDRVAPVLAPRRLLERLAETVRETPLVLRDGEGKIVLRLTLAEIESRGAEGATVADAEIRLDPVKGYAKPARKAEARLGGIGAVGGGDPGARMRRAGVSPGDYSSKFHVALDPWMPAEAAARRIHGVLLDQMAANEAGTAARTDIEFLHDFRVAIRRTRSALEEVSQDVLPEADVAAAKEAFRWLGRQTNRMRDLDVYLLAYPDLRDGLPEPYRPALEPFRAHLQAEARAEGRKVAALVEGAEYRRIRDDWRAKIAAGAGGGPYASVPVRSLADARIRAACATFVAKGRKIGAETPARKLHKLRVHGKKLRYLLEFFRSLGPEEEIAGLVSALKKIQDTLGAFQDATVQAAAIRGFAGEMAAAGRAGVETQMAMGMVAETMLARQAGARAAFLARFGKFAKRAAPDRIAAAFPAHLPAREDMTWAS